MKSTVFVTTDGHLTRIQRMISGTSKCVVSMQYVSACKTSVTATMAHFLLIKRTNGVSGTAVKGQYCNCNQCAQNFLMTVMTLGCSRKRSYDVRKDRKSSVQKLKPMNFM
jgi:DNA-binding FrmR family transcriptional regulator